MKNKNLSEGLENSETPKLNKNFKTDAPQFSNREWLENNDPRNFITTENSSNKHDEVRETEVQKGLQILATNPINGSTLSSILILLGRWWECKPARNAIKTMIDEEAEAKGYDSVTYLQGILDAEVQTISAIQTAIDRVRYAKTYYKPRNNSTPKIITKQINIDGVVYIVPVAKFEEAKIEFAKDKVALKAAVIAFSTPQNDLIEEL